MRVIGTVPVESDGSASFKVPADTAVYFQALDERHMEIRRMRSMVSFKPGEVRGCRGCHESQARTPASRPRLPLAARRQAQHARRRRPGAPSDARLRVARAADPRPPLYDATARRSRTEGSTSPPPARPTACCSRSARCSPRRRSPRRRSPRRRSRATDIRAELRAPGPTAFLFPAPIVSATPTSPPKQFGSHRSVLIQTLLNDSLHRDESRPRPRRMDCSRDVGGRERARITTRF